MDCRLFLTIIMSEPYPHCLDDSFKDARQIEEELSYINEPQTQDADKGKEKAVDPHHLNLDAVLETEKNVIPKIASMGNKLL